MWSLSVLSWAPAISVEIMYKMKQIADKAAEPAI